MPGISIHVVDVSHGAPAAGLKVAVFRIARGARTQIAGGRLSKAGTLDDAALAGPQTAGQYEVDFHVADFYAAAGVALALVPFLDVVTYRFGIADPAQHYHLPLKCTPWGFSCFRGGL
jgi:5-hydroxyisourate hydrolase